MFNANPCLNAQIPLLVVVHNQGYMYARELYVSSVKGKRGEDGGPAQGLHHKEERGLRAGWGRKVQIWRLGAFFNGIASPPDTGWKAELRKVQKQVQSTSTEMMGQKPHPDPGAQAKEESGVNLAPVLCVCPCEDSLFIEVYCLHDDFKKSNPSPDSGLALTLAYKR